MKSYFSELLFFRLSDHHSMSRMRQISLILSRGILVWARDSQVTFVAGDVDLPSILVWMLTPRFPGSSPQLGVTL